MSGFGPVRTIELDDDPYDEAYERAKQRELDGVTSADCDACGKRPGTHWVNAFGIETWACDVCTGRASG